MKNVTNTLNYIIKVTQWLAMAVALTMMVFIFIAVIGRAFNHPILGDVELVELGMVLLIMFGLGYTQSVNGHISIGLLIDLLPKRVQQCFDLLAYVLIVSVSWVISWVFLLAANKESTGTVITSNLLSIPEYPFKYVIAFGMLLWGLVALFKFFLTIYHLLKNDNLEAPLEEGEER